MQLTYKTSDFIESMSGLHRGFIESISMENDVLRELAAAA